MLFNEFDSKEQQVILPMQKFFIIGIIGAIITLIGEMSQGLAESVPATDMIAETLATYAVLPVWRIGFGSTIGAVGIILQYFGVYAIYLSFKDKNDKNSKLYKIGIYNYAFVGAIIHILMSLMILIYKINRNMIIEFTVWFVMPILIVFLIGYIWMSIILFNKIRKNETMFPAWCCVLNPIVGKLVFNVISEIIPNSKVANGIGYSNMGLTAIIMFAILLLSLNRKAGS